MQGKPDAAPEQSDFELKFRTVIDAALDAIVLGDMAGNIISWNSGAQEMFGYGEDEVVGKPLTILMPERFHEAHIAGLNRLRDTSERRLVGRTSELYARRKDGQEFPIEISLGTWVTSRGRFFCGIIRDATERKSLEEALRYAALHDPLLQLPNRVLLAEELQRAAALAARRGSKTLVMVIDLDDFKAVNDRFGHQAGDALLREAADRLKALCRAGDTLARLGGDEFAALFEDVSGRNAAAAIAGRITEALGRPLALEDQTVTITASVGAAFVAGGFVPEEVLREADRALYIAKGRGKARYEIVGSES